MPTNRLGEMMIGVRIKLVALLTLVAIVPLAVALITITVGGRSMQSEVFGQTIRAMASSKAALLSLSLRKDIGILREGLQHDQIVLTILDAEHTLLSPDELRSLDVRWPQIDIASEPMASILNNACAKRMRQLQQDDRRLAEVLLTDRHGQLVAATGRTSDYYQADEQWWQRTFDEGRGQIYVPPISYDESIEAWSISICLPIRKADTVIGIAKVVVDASQWIGPNGGVIGSVTADLRLVRSDSGIIIHGRGRQPMAAVSADWSGAITSRELPGWRISSAGEIQGFSPVILPDRVGSDRLVAPSWSVIYAVERGEAMAAVHRLSLIVLVLGTALIGALFIFGLYLVERSIVRRIRRLAGATRQVAKGDLSHRVIADAGERRLLGRDEIDSLADDFNHMLERVQRSHAELEAGNEMKMNFIRIAGHELRTPISYILATVKLLRDSTDPNRLLHAVQSMGAKAKRLDQIIHAMFKLMPRQQYSEQMNCSEVNVKELLEDVYLDSFPFVQSRNQQLTVSCADGLPIMTADRNKLFDIVENLIMNAIKFTPDGGTITVTAGMELGGYVSLAVCDQGPGIPDAEQRRIFEPFYSGGDVMRHSSGSTGFHKRGMGLGLAIVKHFVQMHGGTIRVNNISGGGCCFTVLIPSEREASGSADQ